MPPRGLFVVLVAANPQGGEVKSHPRLDAVFVATEAAPMARSGALKGISAVEIYVWQSAQLQHET